MGLDYDYVDKRGLYGQVLRHAIARARERDLSTMYLGFGAGIQKARFGARGLARCVYTQADDHYAAEAIAQMGEGAGP